MNYSRKNLSFSIYCIAKSIDNLKDIKDPELQLDIDQLELLLKKLNEMLQNSIH